MAFVIVAGNDGWQNKEVKRRGNQHSDKQERSELARNRALTLSPNEQ